MQANGVDHTIKLALGDLRGRQFDLVDVGHQIAKYAALAAAGGHHALGAALDHDVGVRAGFDGSHAGLAQFSFSNRPVHGDGFDLGHGINQTLVAQETQHQPLGLGAQSHQGHQLFFIQVNGQSTLSGDLRLGGLTEFVAHGHTAGQGCTRSGDVGLERGRCGLGGVQNNRHGLSLT